MFESEEAARASLGARRQEPERPLQSVALPVAAVLALQRTAGNQRTASLLGRRALHRAPVAAPQSPPQSGLAAPAATTEFAAKAVAFVLGQPDATVARLVEVMGTLTDRALMGQKVPPLTAHRQARIAEGATAALFEGQHWDMVIDIAKSVIVGPTSIQPPPATVAGLTPAQVASLADSVYHESRHAEQAFRVAQLMARSEHKDAITIAAELQIPLNIAALAVSSWAATAAPADPAAVAQTEGWQAFRAGGRHADYRRFVIETKDDLLRVLADMPRMKDVQATPGLRAALDQWEQLVIETKIPEWRKSFNAMFKKKMPTLDKARVPVDADLEKQLGRNINVALTNLFQAARTLRKLQANHAAALNINVAEEQLQFDLLDAFLTAENAEQAFPEETDARAVGGAVAAAVNTLYTATAAQTGAAAATSPQGPRR